MSVATIRTIGDLTTQYKANKATTIVDETNQTLSNLILKVSDKDTIYKINIDGQAKYVRTPSKLYGDGLTSRMKWFPWIHTYDDTDDIYVVIFEPDMPVKFKKLTITVVPKVEITYSFMVGIVKDVSGITD